MNTKPARKYHRFLGWVGLVFGLLILAFVFMGCSKEPETQSENEQASRSRSATVSSHSAAGGEKSIGPFKAVVRRLGRADSHVKHAKGTI
jgi:hypothetical protein